MDESESRAASSEPVGPGDGSSELELSPAGSLGRLRGSRLLIIAHGTDYEVEPYVVLACHLMDVCRQVSVLIPRHLKLRWKTKLPSSCALRFFELDGNLDGEIAGLTVPIEPAALFAALSNYMKTHLRRNYQTAWDVCGLERPTALLCAANCIPESLAIGQRLQLPTYILPIYPLSPSAALPPVLAFSEPFRLGAMNRLVHWMARSATWRVFGDIVNDFRAELDLPLEDEASFDGVPQLCLFHTSVQPLLPDWPPSVAAFNFPPPHPVLAAAEARSGGHALDAFLRQPDNDGKPIVYCDLAPLPAAVAARLHGWLVAAAARLDYVCVVYLSGDAATLPTDNDAEAQRRVYPVARPQIGLLPRCAAVVHLGAAGLLTRVLFAGAANVLLPAYGEQHYWAWRLAQLGLAPAEPLASVFQLTETQLVDRLTFALGSGAADLRARCLALKAALDSQPVDALYQWLDARLAADRNDAGIAMQWCADQDAKQCAACAFNFAIWSTVLHCYSCGRVFCSACITAQAELPSTPGGPKRVCSSCIERRHLTVVPSSSLFS